MTCKRQQEQQILVSQYHRKQDCRLPSGLFSQRAYSTFLIYWLALKDAGDSHVAPVDDERETHSYDQVREGGCDTVVRTQLHLVARLRLIKRPELLWVRQTPTTCTTEKLPIQFSAK